MHISLIFFSVFLWYYTQGTGITIPTTPAISTSTVMGHTSTTPATLTTEDQATLATLTTHCSNSLDLYGIHNSKVLPEKKHNIITYKRH